LISPECNKLLKRNTLASGNTFGAIHYSDDKVEAPHLPALPVLSKCTYCDTIFWLEDIEEIGRYSGIKPDNKEWEAAESVKILDIDDLIRALTLEDVVAEKDDELFIRKSTWWAYNDRVRNGEKLHESLEDEIKWRENINQLMNLFDSDVDYDKIFIAAIKEECQNQNTLVVQLR